MRPNFKNIDIKNAGFAAHNAAEWAKANGIEADWKTPEHIQVLLFDKILFADQNIHLVHVLCKNKSQNLLYQ